MAAKIVAAILFISMFGFMVNGRFERHKITLVTGGIMLVLVQGIIMGSGKAVMEVLAIKDLFLPGFWFSKAGPSGGEMGINWATIIFIAGMMIMVEGLGKSGFFRWLCQNIAKWANFDPKKILILFMIMSAALAMFIDSITVILFLATATLELAKLLKFNPIPMLITEIFCANLGGSATMCGDPPNIIVGTALNYSFFDFLKNTGVIALVGMFVAVVFLYWRCRKKLNTEGVDVEEIKKSINPKDAIKDKKSFFISSFIFGLAILLLVSHEQTGLTVASIGVLIGFLSLLLSKERNQLLKDVDGETLLFFIGLFIVVGGLESTHMLEVIAESVAKLGAGSDYLCVALIMLASAGASAIIDNIPFAAVMIPIIKHISIARGIPLDVLAWSLSIGTDIGGSATPIGASANVVGISVAGKHGKYIGWGHYCRDAVPATVLVLTSAAVVIYIRYFAM